MAPTICVVERFIPEDARFEVERRELAVDTGGTMTITSSMVSGNSVHIVGGGIWNENRGTVTIASSTVSGNMPSRRAVRPLMPATTCFVRNPTSVEAADR